MIVRRGSTREFSRDPITFAQLSTMLDRATRGIEADFLARQEPSLNELYLIVHAVEGLPSGAYVFRRQERAWNCSKKATFAAKRAISAWVRRFRRIAASMFISWRTLKVFLARFGNRGYRVAQLEAAIMGGKLYLAAYAQRLGASGLTFFDDDVTEFFSPHAAGKSVMFLVALGKSAKRKTVHP